MRVSRVVLMCVALTAILLVAAPWSRIQAGMIDPGLEQQLQAAGADDLLYVIIRPGGTVVGTALKRRLAAEHATRAARHTAAVLTLQAAAAETQPPILEALNSDYFRDRVANVENFWIDNLITARMTPSAIAEIADRPDVDVVSLMPPIELVRPLAVSDATAAPTYTPAAPQGIEAGLRAIKADSLWKLGITGAGRLVASIDTGVDGDHEFLKNSWRGNNGYSVKESWHEPMYGDAVPRTFDFDAVAKHHGTQVVGIMAAKHPIWPDTLGVCPDCQWISAATLSIPCPGLPFEQCGNVIGAMQWVADPDGDPLTETDVPDAVANPWGIPQWLQDPYTGTWIRIPVGCSDLLFNAIDNIEAAGAAMIFAAGNEGNAPAYPFIRSPANRATSETNAFSVGMVNTNLSIENPPVDPLSSRGPSDCDNISIKPEVVAPGVLVRTIKASNGIDSPTQPSGYGTSYATPHVAAGIALLREYNPNATVDELKLALLQSARDLGSLGPDNAYGHGMIDLVAAMKLLPENDQPSLYVKKNYYERPAPGTSTELVLLLRSAGNIPATGISANLIAEDPHITVLDGTATFPDVGVDGDTTGNFDTPFVLAAAADVIAGERYPVRIEISADGGYARTLRAAVTIGPAQSQEVFTHNAGNFSMSVSAYGTFGLHSEAFSPRPGGEGYFYGDDPTHSLFEGAFLVGTDADHISDNARNVDVVPDVDFQSDPGGLLEIQEPGPRHTEETRAAFSDAVAENPLGLFIEQRTWVDSDPDRDDYLVIEYTIHNRSGARLTGLRAGMFFDWDFPFSSSPGSPAVASRDAGGFETSTQVGYMHHRDEQRFRGLTVLNPMGVTTYRYFDNEDELFDSDGFSDTDKWRGLSEGFVQTTPPFEGDGSHIIATGPFTVEADTSLTVAFAVIGATSFTDLLTSAEQARADYNAGTFTVSPGALQFTAYVDGPDPAPQEISLANGTEAAVDFTVDAYPTWATVIPVSETVNSETDMTLEVTPTIGGRDVGVYTEDIVVTTIDESEGTMEFRVSASLVVTEEQESVAGVHPNPFSPPDEVTLTFTLTNGEDITRAVIYDLAGLEVRTLHNPSSTGATFTWDGTTADNTVVANGVYICHAEGSDEILKIVVKK